jgi:hypothetical protein
MSTSVMLLNFFLYFGAIELSTNISAAIKSGERITQQHDFLFPPHANALLISRARQRKNVRVSCFRLFVAYTHALNQTQCNKFGAQHVVIRAMPPAYKCAAHADNQRHQGENITRVFSPARRKRSRFSEAVSSCH